MRQTMQCVPFWVWLIALNMTIYVPSILQTIMCFHSSSPVYTLQLFSMHLLILYPEYCV